MLLLNKLSIKMTSLQISGEAKLQLVCCNQSQQLTVVTRPLQLSPTVATCLLQPPPTNFFRIMYHEKISHIRRKLS